MSTVEWQRKPNVIMVSAGVRMVPNTTLARLALTRAMNRFCTVTSTEHAQQSREPLNSRGGSAASLPPGEYGGGTTAPDPALDGVPRSEWSLFSMVPFRDRLIFPAGTCCRRGRTHYLITSSNEGDSTVPQFKTIQNTLESPTRNCLLTILNFFGGCNPNINLGSNHSLKSCGESQQR